MVQPPLTEADRHSMALQALQNQRREEQQVRVTFNDRPPGVPAGGQHAARPRRTSYPDVDPPPEDGRPDKAASSRRVISPSRSTAGAGGRPWLR